MNDVTTDTTHQTIVSQRGHVQAMAFARKGGVAFSGLLGSIASAKETERMGPIQVMLFFTETYDGEEQNSIPVPGTKREDAGNKPFDKYTIEVTTKDGKKKVPGSWFTDAVKSTDDWLLTSDRIQWCDNTAYENDDGATCPADILNMGTGERAVEKKRLRQRVADMRTALVKGAMLLHHADDISNLNPARIKVKMPFKAVFVLDNDGQRIKLEGENEYQTMLKVTGNTIRLQDPSGEIEDKVMTVSEFLALKPEKLTGKSEDYTTTALEATKARAPRGNRQKGKGKQEIAIPTTVEQVLNLFNVGATALDTQTDQGAKTSALVLAACATPGAKGDDVVETIGDFALSIDGLWTVISARYNTIKADKAKVLNQAAQAARTTKVA